MCGGQFEPYATSVSVIGVFVNWKMSGVAFNDYADYRVGSPITSDYHWWDLTYSSWHGPFLRAGGGFDEIVKCGQFANMPSPLDMTYVTVGSGSLFLHTNY